MITGTIVGGDQAVQRIRAIGPQINNSLRVTIYRLTAQLSAKVKQDKLSGQALKVVTGRLRRSINMRVDDSGNSIIGSVGTNVKYAAIHEYGGVIPAHAVEPKSARALAFMWNGKMSFYKRVQIPAINMPQRSFLRSALGEMAPTIRQEIEQSLHQSARQAFEGSR